jgi:hypothetical protein
MSAALGRPSFRLGGGAARLLLSWLLLLRFLPCSVCAMEQTLDNLADQIKHLFEVCRGSQPQCQWLMVSCAHDRDTLEHLFE